MKIKKTIAKASKESLLKIFSVPEGENSKLVELEKDISENLLGFLQENIVAGDLSPRELENTFSETTIPDQPCFVSEQARFLFNKVVRQSVHTSSPKFIGHMTSALPYFMLPLAKIMIGLNQNLVKIETSKAFTPLERQVIGMLHRLVYKRDDEFYRKWTQDREFTFGTFCSGGTIANLVCLWSARNKALAARNEFKGVAEDGLFSALKEYGYENLCVLVSKRGHYSLKKSMDLLGLGRKSLVAVETDENHRLRPDKLIKKVRELQQSKVGVLAVVGIAGTTETGNVDPLENIAEICRDHKIHFHVDAAWGGPVLFSKTYGHLLKGIELADSITLDAHKQLYTPMGAGVALMKDVDTLSNIQTHANYIIRKGSRDLGVHTLEGSRPGMALLVHSALKIIGKSGYEILLNQGIEMAETFAKMIRQDDSFELTSVPELNLLTYRFAPKTVQEHLRSLPKDKQLRFNEKLNQLNIKLQKEQRRAGKSFVSRTQFFVHKYETPLNVLRCVLANPLTTKDTLQEILEEQKQIAQGLLMRKQFLPVRRITLPTPTTKASGSATHGRT